MGTSAAAQVEHHNSSTKLATVRRMSRGSLLHPARLPARYNRSGECLVRYLIVLLAIAGVVVSSLALKVHYDTGSEPCRLNDKWDCGVVNHSPYAELHGVPVAVAGVVGYLVIAVLAFLRRRTLLLLIVLVALAFSLYLTHIEASVLGVWCLYCVISQGIIGILTLLAIGWLAAQRFSRPAA
jgi:uncharacterized membrane protein